MRLRTGRGRGPGHRRRSRDPQPDRVLLRQAAARRVRSRRSTWRRPVEVGLPAPLNLAFGAAFRRESYKIRAGELASYVNGFHLDQDSGAVRRARGLVGLPRLHARTTRPSGTGATSGSTPTPRPTSRPSCWPTWRRASSRYSDFGERLSGKVALRYQPSRRVVLPRGRRHRLPRAGPEPGGLQQGRHQRDRRPVRARSAIFPVDHPAALALGAEPLHRGDLVQPQRRPRVHPGGQPHRHGGLLPHPRSTTASSSAPPSTTTRPCSSWRTRGSPTSAGCSTSPTASTPGPRAWTSPATSGCRPARTGTLDLNALAQLHPQRDRPAGLASPRCCATRARPSRDCWTP